VNIVSQAVATKVKHASGKVTGIEYTLYGEDGTTRAQQVTVTADTYVLAANAIQNATLLLASKAANRSGQVGRNLMDHPLLLSWGLLKENVWGYRGPGSTSGITTFRDGTFRDTRTAFRIEIGNWGWSFPAGSPYSTVHVLAGQGESGTVRTYGKTLRKRLGEILPRQFRLAMELEQLPDQNNRVEIDDRYRDRLGNHRPVIHYDLSPYVRAALPWAAQASGEIFQQLAIPNKVTEEEREEFVPGDYSRYEADDPGAVTYEGEIYVVRGAGHLAGTHRMGSDADESVVDNNQRSWDLHNLYIVGCGSMPTIGTSNPTLTMTALAIRTGDEIAKHLEQK
jgi:choline dehydrogenase-like flavoprotein